MQTKENWKKSPAVEKCKMKTEEKPRQKQQNEQAKRLGEYLNFRIQKNLAMGGLETSWPF